MTLDSRHAPLCHHRSPAAAGYTRKRIPERRGARGAGAPGGGMGGAGRGGRSVAREGPGRAGAVAVAPVSGTVSVGCHSVGEVAVARTAGADLALLSPIFRTESHPKARPLGVEALTAAAQTA